MKVFKTRWFARFARQEKIADDGLREAIERAERGLVDADLGGGRSGGYSAIVAYRAASKAFFLHGFAKSGQENIAEDELIALRKFGRRLLAADVETLNAMFEDGSLKEVDDDKEE